MIKTSRPAPAKPRTPVRPGDGGAGAPGRPSDHLGRVVDAWTVEAMVAGAHLVRLYRSLSDERQVVTTFRAIGPAEERVLRLGLSSQVAARSMTFLQGTGGEVAAEGLAWQALVEAQAGICAFHAMIGETPEKATGLRSARGAATKAFQHALRGLRTAFPEVLAGELLQVALAAASRTCAGAFVQDLNDPELEAVDQEALACIQRQVLEGLRAEAGLET